jgi:sugar lactone lactonase YvrE
MYQSGPLTQAHGFTEGIEGPACDSEGNLYAVNFEKQATIGVVTPKGTAYVFAELPQGSTGNGIRFRQDGQMLVADYTGHNILLINMKTRQSSVLAHAALMNQPNDICIMKNGTVFASDPDWRNRSGQLWRLRPGGVLECLERGMGTTNGIEISNDEKTLYVNESEQRRIWAYALSKDGVPGKKRLFTEFPDHGLDGMRCDTEGNLYVTRYGKGVIAKLSPEGKVLLEIQLNGAKPSNLAFGGPDGCTVYVTEVEHGRIESFRVEIPGREWALWLKESN